jgi:hypothetical protein
MVYVRVRVHVGHTFGYFCKYAKVSSRRWRNMLVFFIFLATKDVEKEEETLGEVDEAYVWEHPRARERERAREKARDRKDTTHTGTHTQPHQHIVEEASGARTQQICQW